MESRKGQFCKLLVRGTLNSCAVEFQDGYQMVTSRNAIRKRRQSEEQKANGSDRSGVVSCPLGGLTIFS